MTQVRRYDNYTMSERQGNENTRYTNDEYLDRINHAFLEASRLTQEAEDLTAFEYEDQGEKLHRLFDTYWKLSDSIDRLREEVWDADDGFHRDVNQTAMNWKSYGWRKSGCLIQSDTIHPGEEIRDNWVSKTSWR